MTRPSVTPVPMVCANGHHYGNSTTIRLSGQAVYSVGSHTDVRGCPECGADAHAIPGIYYGPDHPLAPGGEDPVPDLAARQRRTWQRLLRRGSAR